MPKFASSHPEHQVHDEGVTLVTAANAAATAGTAGAAFKLPDFESLICKLETSRLEAGPGDTLDVYIQTYIGGAWWPVFRFELLFGNDMDNDHIHIASLEVPTAQAMYEDTNIPAAGLRLYMFGTQWRAYYVIIGATADFSFDVKIQPVRKKYGPYRRPPNRCR